MSCTTERSAPTSRLNSVLLPTLGRPTMATRGGATSLGFHSASPSSSSGMSMTGSRAPSGSTLSSSSSRSPARRPCKALTACGSPRPSARNSHRSFSRRSLSALLATRMTGALRRRSQLATDSSSWVSPTEASTTNSTTSACLTAASTWRLTFSSSSLPPGSHPPVSTSMNGTPSHSASTSLRSRVTPGRSSTMATCPPTMRLNRVLFPTLGRPTTTTVGKLTTRSPELRHLHLGH